MENRKNAFIIWTLQRTGGTNLAHHLFGRADMRGIQHEPFNKGRVFSHVTEQWLESKNEDLLASQMKEIVGRGLAIKHCVELVPLEISHALAKAACEAGFKHLFLYRKSALDRLLSLHFAQETGIWGPNEKNQATKALGAIAPLPIAKLVHHEKRCIDLLNKMWSYLLAHNAKPLALSYDQLYACNTSRSIDALLHVMKKFGLCRENQDDLALVNVITTNGHQGTKDKYEMIPGSSDLTTALEQVVKFAPIAALPKCGLENNATPEWVVHAKLDVMTPLLPEGDDWVLILGGVIAVTDKAPTGLTLIAKQGEAKESVRWGFRSEQVGKLYPNHPQAATARFKTYGNTVKNGDTLELYLQDGLGRQYPLFKINCMLTVPQSLASGNNIVNQDAVYRRQLADQIMQSHPDEITGNGFNKPRAFYWPEDRAVSDIALKLLQSTGLNVDDIEKLPLSQQFYDSLNALIVQTDPNVTRPLRLANIKPPGHIHWICWPTGVFFDFHSADSVVQTLKECGLAFTPGETYVDFGSSSGRTVRTLWAAYPKCHWVGIDPVKSSIEWASQAFPDIRFIQNEFWPPVNAVSNSSLAGGIAMSVWSHFSEAAAIAWLDEMHRLLRPNGFMVITINGYAELVNFLNKTNNRDFIATPVLEAAMNELDRSGFYFTPNLLQKTVIDDQTHWSHAFIRRKWFEDVVQPRGWKIRYHAHSRWGHKQDIYILEKQ